MFHINKQMVSSPSSSVIFFILLLLPSPFPGERKLLAHVHGLLSHDVRTALTVILADLSVCVCVCVYLGVCVCCMLVFVSVKLAWAPVCRQQPAG